MENDYDEDLNDNTFFQTLQREYSQLYQKSTVEGWVVCVPRAGSLPKYTLTTNDFLSHILVPSYELPETHFRTLNEKNVTICNRVITVEPSDLSEPFSAHILFEETFYTEDFLKYKVLCIETPLVQYSENIRGESGIVNISTLRDCIDLLWTESCKELLEQVDEVISEFLFNNEHLESKSIQIQRDLVGTLYTKCLQIALREPRLREKTQFNGTLLDNVKISVESYMHHGIYKKLIKGITTCTAYEDASFNKTIRNISDIQLRDLDVCPDFQETIPKARSELSKVEGYSTVMGKVGCIQRTISALTKNGTKSQALCADDLLPLLVFLVIKSGLPNWIAHLTYIKEFSFSSSSLYANKHNFLVTSLEAAIEHIRCGHLLGPTEPESQLSEDIDTSFSGVMKIETYKENPDSSSLTHIFNMIKEGNCEEVANLLERGKTVPIGSLEKLKLCHPLCSCDKCEQAFGAMMCNTAPTVNSCDDRGFTVLHIAALYGRPKIIDLVLGLGAKVNATDYKGSTALHYAAARGHQNAVLLLLHANCCIDLQDNEGNTPLHLASSNGHDDCVKALVYFAEYNSLSFNINGGNNLGNTALHNASRWGYEKIVSLLLEYGASPLLKNKQKLSSTDYAHNLNISKLLRSQLAKKINPSVNKDITVAAAQKTRLDLSETRNCDSRPSTTAQIKKLDRLFSSIMHGDVNLAKFYLGLTEDNKGKCHPLCRCEERDRFESDRVKIPDNSDSLVVNVSDPDGMTPLHVAAKYGRRELVSLLLQAGSMPDLVTKSGRTTALHFACQSRSTECVQAILEKRGSLINAKDSLGNTPLHYACESSNIKLVKTLLQYTPQVNVKNYQGMTPLDIAKSITSLSLVNLLSSIDKNS